MFQRYLQKRGGNMKKVLLKDTKKPITNLQKNNYLKIMAEILFSASSNLIGPQPPLEKRSTKK